MLCGWHSRGDDLFKVGPLSTDPAVCLPALQPCFSQAQVYFAANSGSYRDSIAALPVCRNEGLTQPVCLSVICSEQNYYICCIAPFTEYLTSCKDSYRVFRLLPHKMLFLQRKKYQCDIVVRLRTGRLLFISLAIIQKT